MDILLGILGGLSLLWLAFLAGYAEYKMEEKERKDIELAQLRLLHEIRLLHSKIKQYEHI